MGIRKNPQNRITIESISTALMILMQENNFNEITISDITKKAGVSRMAFYRNYNHKEDIITKYLDELFEEYSNEISCYENADELREFCLFFSYFRKHERLILNLINSKITYLLLDSFDKYLDICFRNHIGKKAYSSQITKYIIELTSGGLYKVLIEWVKNGLKESDEEMAKIFSNYFDTSSIIKPAMK